MSAEDMTMGNPDNDYNDLENESDDEMSARERRAFKRKLKAEAKEERRAMRKAQRPRRLLAKLRTKFNKKAERRAYRDAKYYAKADLKSRSVEVRTDANSLVWRAKNPALACVGDAFFAIIERNSEHLFTKDAEVRTLQAAEGMARVVLANRARRLKYVALAVMSAWVLVLAAVLGLTLGCVGKQTPGVLRPTAMQESTAVKVTTWCIEEDEATVSLSKKYGSGVIINATELLTANHVTVDATCAGAIAIGIETVDGKRYGATVARAYPTIDIARLRIDGTFDVKPARPGPRPKVGATVCTSTSFPKRTRQCGKVESYAKTPGDLRFEVNVIKGNSGSGLYDAEGKLVGIVTHLVPCLVTFSPAGMMFHGSCGGRATSIEGPVSL